LQHTQGGTHTTRPRATPTLSSTIRPLRLTRIVIRTLLLRRVQLIPLSSIFVEDAHGLSPGFRGTDAIGTHRNVTLHRIGWWTDGPQMVKAAQTFIARFYTMFGRRITHKITLTISIG